MRELIDRGALLEEIHTARNQSILGKTAAAKLEKFVKAAPVLAVRSDPEQEKTNAADT